MFFNAYSQCNLYVHSMFLQNYDLIFIHRLYSGSYFAWLCSHYWIKVPSACCKLIVLELKEYIDRKMSFISEA
jgi:hypothetical protein